MEIKGEIKVKGFLSIEDLQYGDIFTFLDENTPYILSTSPYCDDLVVNLYNGEGEEVDDEIGKRPIRRLKATLFVED